MPLSASSRNDLYGKLHEIGISERTLEELLACLPRSSYDAPVTRTQLDDRERAIAAEQRKRLAEVERQLDERLRIKSEGLEKRFEITDDRLEQRLKITDERLTTIQRERHQEQVSPRAIFIDIAPILMVFIGFLALLALVVASRAGKTVERSDDTRGAQVIELTTSHR